MHLFNTHLFYERIDLASKLRKVLPKWRWSLPFSGKKSPHKFSETDPSNHIISRFSHFEQPFSLQNQKTPFSTTLKTFFNLISLAIISWSVIFHDLNFLQFILDGQTPNNSAIMNVQRAIWNFLI